MSASDRGIGVAVSSSTSGAEPLLMSAARCSTPKRCCSSITTSPSCLNATVSCSSACVPMMTRAAPDAMRFRDDALSAAGIRPSSTSGMMPSGASRRASVVACCSVSSSVGAMSAAWCWFSSATSIASSATTVLPVPTSPISSRCMRSGAAMSAGDLRQRLLLVARERPGQRFAQPPGEGGVAHLRQATLVALGQRARARQHQLHVEQLVERQAPPPEFRLGGTGRAVHHAQRLGQRRAGPAPRAAPAAAGRR